MSGTPLKDESAVPIAILVPIGWGVKCLAKSATANRNPYKAFKCKSPGSQGKPGLLRFRSKDFYFLEAAAALEAAAMALAFAAASAVIAGPAAVAPVALFAAAAAAAAAGTPAWGAVAA